MMPFKGLKHMNTAASVILAAVLIFTTVLGGVGTALAHKYYAALSVIEYNPREKRVEITHRLFAHDVEAYLTEQQGKDILWDEPEVFEPLLKKMFEEDFLLSMADEGEQHPTYVGFEVVGQLMYVYYTIPRETMDPPHEFTVENDVLMGRFHDQVNTVNIYWGAERVSTNFIKGDTIKTLTMK